MVRHWHPDFVPSALRDRRLLPWGPDDAEDTPAAPDQLAGDLEALGPTFVKLGQLLASRADLLPEPYIEALGRLQDAVGPMPFSEVQATIEEELGAEPDVLFREFDPAPLASASLGQVHRATLRDGRQVAVKVQRPGLRQPIVDDFAAFDALAALLDEHTDLGRRYGFTEMVDELRSLLLNELDYLAEARNLERIGDSLSDCEHLTLPRPVRRLTSSRVLTMDFVEGAKVTELEATQRDRLPGRQIAEELCEAYLDQILVTGYFHADPHPGNVLVTPDDRLGILDLGMVAHLSPAFRRNLFKLVIAVADGDSDGAAEACISLGTRLDDFDRAAFLRRVTRLVGQAQGARLEEGGMARLVFALARAGAESGVRPPAELAIVGKTMLYLDQLGAELDPEFRMERILRHEVARIAGRQLLGGLRPRKSITTALELDRFMRGLPRRLDDVLTALVDRELEVRVRAFDETNLMASLHRIGTRITLGLVFTAIIVAGALVARTDGPGTIGGYPVLAVILLAVGLIGGAGLVGWIVANDFWRNRR